MVEIEIGVLRGQCLDRRIDDANELKREITAWQRQRNAAVMQRPVFMPLLLSLTCLPPLALGAVLPKDEGPPLLMSRIGVPVTRERALPILSVLGSLRLDFSRTETRSAEPQRHPDVRRTQARARRVARRSRPQQHLGGTKHRAAFLRPLKLTKPL
jgi:hypothetical protein